MSWADGARRQRFAPQDGVTALPMRNGDAQAPLGAHLGEHKARRASLQLVGRPRCH
jgi:hypothetical protein